MAEFELQTNDGKKYRIEAASPEDARRAFDHAFGAPSDNPPPPGVMIHEADRSYITGAPDAPSVDTRGMAPGIGMGAVQGKPGMPNRAEAAAALALRQRGGEGAIVPRTLEPFIQGATMNLGDEVASAGTGLANLVRGGAFDQAYSLAQEAQRQDLAQTRQENPITSLVAQMAGGLATAPALGALGLGGSLASPGASLGTRILGGAGAGAGYGAVSGFGEGSSAEDRAAKMIPGAAIGTVLGGALPGAVEAVRRGTNYFLDRGTIGRQLETLGVGRPAADSVMRALEADDAFTGGIGNQAIAAAGRHGMLADAGASTQSLLDTAIQKGGAGSREARQAVEQRGTAANQQLTDALDAVLGQPRGLQTMQNEISTAGRAGRRAAYDTAYSSPIDYSTQAGRDLESLINNRVPHDAIAEANAAMRIRGEPPSAQIRATIDQNGNAVFDRLPDVRQIDYITRGLRQRAESPDVVGALGGRTMKATDLLDLAGEIRTTTRGLVPAYGRALDTAADDIGRVQATRLGAEILSPAMTRDDVVQALARHQNSAAEMAQVRAGVRSYVDDVMARVKGIATDPNQDARETARILKDLNSRETIDKLDMVVTDPLQRQELANQIGEASRAIQLRANMTTNSRTFGRTVQNEANQRLLEYGPLGAAARGEPLNALQRATQALTGRTPGYDLSRSDAMNREIANLLTVARGPDAQRQLGLLRDAYRVGPQNAARAEQVAGATGLAAGLPGYQLLRGLLGY